MATLLYMYEAKSGAQFVDKLREASIEYLEAQMKTVDGTHSMRRVEAEALIRILPAREGPFGCPAIWIGVVHKNPPSVALAWDVVYFLAEVAVARVWLPADTYSADYLAERGVEAQASLLPMGQLGFEIASIDVVSL